MIEFCAGIGDGFHEVFACRVLDVVDLAYRITRRETAAQRRRDEQVAYLDVRIAGQERKFQALAITKTERDGLQSGAIDLDGNAMVRISNQQRLRSAWAYFDNLAHDAGGVDQCLATINLFVAALVESDLMAIRVLADRNDFGNQYVVLQVF